MIRPIRDGDVTAVAPIVAASEPWLTSERGLRHRIRSAPERGRGRWWVAEEGGDVLGVAFAGVEWHLAGGEVGAAWTAVRPDRRGEGIGTALSDVADEYVRTLGVRRVRTEALDERFARARGYEVARRSQLWEIDLREFERPNEAEPGGTLRPLGELRERARELYEMYIAIESAMPHEEQWTGYSFDEWRLDTLANPDLDDDTSIVALVGDRMASASLLLVSPDGKEAEVEVTGTLPEFRRRGLARACKVESMRRAHERGIRRIVTDNDVTNEPMLALNRALGFRPAGFVLELVKRL